MRSAFGWMFLAAAGLIVVSCETQDLAGAWAYEDARSYVGISLDGDGGCQVVEVAKGGAGVGGECRYEVAGRTVTVFPVPRDDAQPAADTALLTLTYRTADDSFLAHGDATLVLSRTAGLVTQ